MKAPNIETALRIYNEFTEIGTPEIMELFDCQKNSACRLKKKVKEKMAQSNIRCFMPNNVNVEVAYQVWGIDIQLYERRLKNQQRLKLSKEVN